MGPLENSAADHLLGMKICNDPRKRGPKNINTIIALGSIHKEIVSTAFLKSGDALSEQEKLEITLCLSSVFIIYFRRFELNEETWNCQFAWMNLLRLRYHSIARLYENRVGYGITDNEETQAGNLLRAARRDWIRFCMDADNHFLFSTAIPDEQTSKPDDGIYWPEQIAGVEGELDLIIRPDLSGPPYKFYLDKHGRGRRVLDQLIADWFLRDRARWFEAFALAWHRGVARICERRLWKLLAVVAVALSIGLIARYVVAPLLSGDITLVNASLRMLYPLLTIIAIASVFWRTVMDLMLPRVWAGTMVGYLPLFLTSELWKIVYPKSQDQQWWGSQCWGIFLLNFISASIAFLYLRWEVANRLVRTPGLSRWAPIRRAFWLTILGLLFSIALGLAVFDVIGSQMASASLDPDALKIYQGTKGLIGSVHMEALFLFAPFALLVGVILQIFWEEKPITQTA